MHTFNWLVGDVDIAPDINPAFSRYLIIFGDNHNQIANEDLLPSQVEPFVNNPQFDEAYEFLEVSYDEETELWETNMRLQNSGVGNILLGGIGPQPNTPGVNSLRRLWSRSTWRNNGILPYQNVDN